MPTPYALLTLALGFAAACGQVVPSGSSASAPDSTPVPAPVAAPASVMGPVIGANVAWGDFYGRGDAPGIATLYAEDAVLMTPAGDVTGRVAIQERFARLFRDRMDSILATNTATETLDVAGPRAYEAGTIVFTVGPRTGGGTGIEHRVRYMTFWQQAPDGRWLIRASLRPDPTAP